MIKSMATSLACILVLAGSVSAQQPAGDKQRVEGVVASIGYANAIQIGNTVYISGVVSGGATMEEQVTGIYNRLGQILARFGATMDDVVKETAFTTDMEGLKAANAIRRKAYGTHAPTATWVQIVRLFMESAKVEIEFVAVPGSGKKD